MPMPKKGKREVRRRQFPVRWSLDEFALLKKGAALQKLEPSVYLRWLVMRDTANK